MFGAAASETSNVKVINTENFERLVAKDTWLLEFYAPWCGHCKRLAPIYEQVATALNGEVHVAKCDATVDRGLAARFPVTGYPSIYLVNGSAVYDYDGSRNKESIVNFARKGWKKATPLSFFKSPFSIIGKVKGYLIATGLKLIDLHE